MILAFSLILQIFLKLRRCHWENSTTIIYLALEYVCGMICVSAEIFTFDDKFKFVKFRQTFFCFSQNYQSDLKYPLTSKNVNFIGIEIDDDIRLIKSGNENQSSNYVRHKPIHLR